jgi:hypothetical protein
MPNVIPTTLDTTQPGHSELTICDGFALYQDLGIARARTSLDDTQGSFFDKTINFEVFKITIASDHADFLGVCGPGYAIKADTLAETEFTIPANEADGGTGTLVLGEHAIRGGFQCGLIFQIDIDVNISAHIGFFHHTLVDVFGLVYINFIQLILNELIALLTAGQGGGDSGDPNDIELSEIDPNNGNPEVEEGHPSGEGSGGEGPKPAGQKFDGAGMVDASTNPFVPGAETSFTGPPADVIEPSLSYGFDIIPLIIEASGLEPLAAVAHALEDVGSGIELGPGFSVGLPTTITLEGATIDNHPFDVTGGRVPSGGGEATVELDLVEQTPVSPNLQPLEDPADEIGFLLKHEVGISVGLYFFAEVMFFKVIHIGAQTGQLPLFFSTSSPTGGPFHNQLSFVPGGGPVPFAPPDTPVTITGYTANQPQGRWQGGILARYGVSYFNSDYESPLGPLTVFDAQSRFFAFPTMTDLPGPVPDAVGIRIYREFNDGSNPERVGEIEFDDVITTFTDTTP